MKLTQTLLKECLVYHAETGEFRWLARPESHFSSKAHQKRWNSRHAGLPAGSIDDQGYLQMMVLGKKYRAHRIAWLYVHGEWPEDQIDHINHDRADNRIINLRSVSRQDNNKNVSLNSRSVSGVLGVRWRKRYGKWEACIKINGKTSHLGHHSDFFEAICKRKSAEKKNGFHANHGS